MPDARQQLELLNDELQDILDGAPKDRLARAARLLGMYLALYKHHYGELSAEDYRELNQHVALQDTLGQAIYTTGMHELIDMLAVVEHHERDDGLAGAQSAQLN